MGILTADELEGGDGAAASGGDEVLAELERCQAELKVILVTNRIYRYRLDAVIIRYSIIQYLFIFYYLFLLIWVKRISWFGLKVFLFSIYPFHYYFNNKDNPSIISKYI